MWIVPDKVNQLINLLLVLFPHNIFNAKQRKIMNDCDIRIHRVINVVLRVSFCTVFYVPR